MTGAEDLSAPARVATALRTDVLDGLVPPGSRPCEVAAGLRPDMRGELQLLVAAIRVLERDERGGRRRTGPPSHEESL